LRRLELLRSHGYHRVATRLMAPADNDCLYQEEVNVTVNDQDPYSVNHIDRDPEETEEWNDSLESVVENRQPRGTSTIDPTQERGRG
ncbi:MAG: aceE, partial [Mycobacterium sp.]|nr:aceE [Mycobacterium sp.]